MNPSEQKERALTFLKNFEKPDPKAYEGLIADNTIVHRELAKRAAIRPSRVA